MGSVKSCQCIVIFNFDISNWIFALASQTLNVKHPFFFIWSHRISSRKEENAVQIIFEDRCGSKQAWLWLEKLSSAFGPPPRPPPLTSRLPWMRPRCLPAMSRLGKPTRVTMSLGWSAKALTSSQKYWKTVSWEREIRVSLLRLLPLQPGPGLVGKKLIDGRMGYRLN